MIKRNSARFKRLRTAETLADSKASLSGKDLLQALNAFKRGDFSVRLPIHWSGIDAKIAESFNDVVALNQKMASELTRLSRVVGKEGRVSQRVNLYNVDGAWAESVCSVNDLLDDLVQPTTETARVIGAVAKGDLSQTMATEVEGRPLQGAFLRTAKTVNTMVNQLGSFAAEVTRVAREVGSEGKLGGQAKVKGVAGTWKDLTDSVNSMAGNLTAQVRNIAAVTTAVANGDLSKKITVDVKGEILELKNTVNIMVDQLSSFASEVTRVAREVGTEGKLGGQADVRGVAGTWKDLTENVNSMAGNLTSQVRNIAAVTTAVANGDLSKKITVDVKGEILQLKDTINTMVDQLRSFASEVTRVAREVGTEGKLGGQADVKGVAGTWKDLTESVNSMAGNLTAQVRNIAAVTTAVANGDLSKKITVDVRGEILELKDTINTMVDQLRSFASEVTRVAREVGTEGKLGGQADVQGVAGTWKDLTDSVNSMAGNLTSQVRNIAAVTTAVANGDLSKKITVDVKGEILELKDTINTMVDQLRSFASEVTRVAREVGTEGKLGGQADVQGVAGTWKDLTDNVNMMASNLTAQVRNIAEVTTAVANGDLSKKITVDVKGEILELKDTINTMVDQLSSFGSEVTRVATEVGTQGKLGGQADVKGVAGTWKDLTDSVNSMAGNLTDQVRNIAAVTTAVANGDLSKKITVDVKGEILELKDTINTMVDQLNSFASEVTRVAREVGSEGKLGGQAEVRGVSGTWKDLTDNVNSMAGNLTGQVRGIAKVVTAVAKGDLKQKLTVEAKGEIAELAETINGMTSTLATFAEQVTTVAREVGVEGKLGGQASVPGAAGTWKDLTDNVNQLAENLTTQVRAIAEVATAVTKGDLTRSIKVEALGEVAVLKDNINEMIRNLKDTTLKNSEQNWLKTNLAKFSRMLQGQKDLFAVGRLFLSELAPVVGAQQGTLYTMHHNTAKNEPELKLLASYANEDPKRLRSFKLGQGLVGQCAVERQKIVLSNIPGDYLRISSSLGHSKPANILVLPVLFEGQVKGVLELASFEWFSPTHQVFLDQLMESVGIVINTIEANMRTEDLLKQSQSLAKELQSRQEELQQTNQELEEKAKLLAEQNVEVERKNMEVEQARSALEEKARQLSLTSKYKSEFLANMSHELRTPLNSLLILSDQLSKNLDKNLTSKQVEFAKTIHVSGNELLELINDILDLSKIESGTVTVEACEIALSDLQDYVERAFRHVAESKKLKLAFNFSDDLPRSVYTDAKRIQQVLKNLLSNAFKFTEDGGVSLKVSIAKDGWNHDLQSLKEADAVIAFSVVDTGIGIHPDKQQIIFEAFQQADGSTSRKYGGTGLGLAISREIAQMLGGEITIQSQPNHGSTFTLYLPREYKALKNTRKPAALTRDIEVKHTPLSHEPSHASTTPTTIASAADIHDDRDHLDRGDRVVLLIENDISFSKILLEMAHDCNFKALIAKNGNNALSLARDYIPHAITLDMRLPDIDGWKVLSRLKDNLSTRHIPVCVISTDEECVETLKLGAWAVINKPIQTKTQIESMFNLLRDYLDRSQRKLVLASSSEEFCQQAEDILTQNHLLFTGVKTGYEAWNVLLDSHCDCLITDLALPDMPELELVEKISREDRLHHIPIIVCEHNTPRASEMLLAQKARQKLAVKSVKSMERLLDEAMLFLHLPFHELKEPQRRILENLHKTNKCLAHKRVLIVDDDIRNIFALTSLLEGEHMIIRSAETGIAAIEQLKEHADTDIVLMDIMMPGMDGYDTIRQIREMEAFKNLPIIAVTAKAMKGDREKCLDAGASDYLAKPVDTEQLYSLLRFWLNQ